MRSLQHAVKLTHLNHRHPFLSTLRCELSLDPPAENTKRISYFRNTEFLDLWSHPRWLMHPRYKYKSSHDPLISEDNNPQRKTPAPVHQIFGLPSKQTFYQTISGLNILISASNSRQCNSSRNFLRSQSLSWPWSQRSLPPKTVLSFRLAVTEKKWRNESLSVEIASSNCQAWLAGRVRGREWERDHNLYWADFVG